MSTANCFPLEIRLRHSPTILLTSSTPTWKASIASAVVGSLPEVIDDASKPFCFLHWYKIFETPPVSFPAYKRIFCISLTPVGRYRSRVAIFPGSDGSCHPSVGPQTRDNGSAKSIFPPCLYRFSTMDNRSETSANFQALSWPLLDRLFSNNAGLWSVYKVIPASMLVSIRFRNFSRASNLPNASR